MVTTTQLMALGEIKDVKEARQIVANSETTYEYEPQDKGKLTYQH